MGAAPAGARRWCADVAPLPFGNAAAGSAPRFDSARRRAGHARHPARSRRHEAELDFRREAANLAECKANLIRRGFEPRLARIPSVISGSGGRAALATQHVLAMEALPGHSLGAAIAAEQAELAAALGLKVGKTTRSSSTYHI